MKINPHKSPFPINPTSPAIGSYSQMPPKGNKVGCFRLVLTRITSTAYMYVGYLSTGVMYPHKSPFPINPTSPATGSYSQMPPKGNKVGCFRLVLTKITSRAYMYVGYLSTGVM